MQKERANVGSLPWASHKSTREVKSLQVAPAFWQGRRSYNSSDAKEDLKEEGKRKNVT